MCLICDRENLLGKKSLTIQICPKVKAIPYIEGLQRLDIIQCKNISKIAPIKSLIVLIIIGCPNITSLPNLPLLKGLKLQCKGLKQIPQYENLERLELHNESVVDIPEYSKLQYLYLNHVNTIELPIYPTLLSLEIHNSKCIMTIPNNNHLCKLVIQSCLNLLCPNSLTEIIKNCKNLKDSFIINNRYINDISINCNSNKSSIEEVEIDTDNNIINNVKLTQSGKRLKNAVLLLEQLYYIKNNLNLK